MTYLLPTSRYRIFQRVIAAARPLYRKIPVELYPCLFNEFAVYIDIIAVGAADVPVVFNLNRPHLTPVQGGAALPERRSACPRLRADLALQHPGELEAFGFEARRIFVGDIMHDNLMSLP